MSRSRRHRPIHGIAGGSEQYDKRLANRRLRRTHKQLIRSESEIDIVILPVMRDISNVWSFNKDGKSYFGQMEHTDPALYRKLMSK